MEKIDTAIIGAGVIGLSVAAELAKTRSDIFIFERHDSFGQETSSRNSEVIHAGIYYQTGSLKHTLCIEGRNLLYDFCAGNAIPHKKVGKLIVASNEHEMCALDSLYTQGRTNGNDTLRLISKNELRELEPEVTANAAILSPETGIIDSHAFMKKLAGQCAKEGVGIAYNHTVCAIDRDSSGFIINVRDPSGSTVTLGSRIVINCAGLASDCISSMAGLTRPEYKLRFCKGDYCRVRQSKARLISRLIYPVPHKRLTGLGIHATLDLAGGMRLGPDDEYVNTIDYAVKPEKCISFYENTHKFMPFIKRDDITTDTSGIRPKLSGPGEPARDFVIRDETDNGCPGLINLIGIESPGLTASLAIAKMVAQFPVLRS